ncbi:MAG: alpha/beta hydrolase [Bacteroidaceae bacterium]|nr:alpha/beta hydrolase [Bacteroidaceae bacterium]
MKGSLCFLLLFLTCQFLCAEEKYKWIKDIPYVASSDTSQYRRERCKLDVYYPQGKKGFKTLVWFHGGGLTKGSKSLRKEFMERGYAVVPANYRLFPRCKNPDYTRDAAAAVAWVVKHIGQYGGDASQIYVAGHSAGAYLALMLALDKQYLGQYGIDADSVKGYFPLSGQTATHFTIKKERGLDQKIPLVEEYAPLHHVRKLNTQLVLVTGDRHMEMAMRYEENLYLKAALENVGNAEIPLFELSGFAHSPMCGPGCQIVDRYLRGK